MFNQSLLLVLFLKGEVAFIFCWDHHQLPQLLTFQDCSIISQRNTTFTKESPSNDILAILAVYTFLSAEVMQFVPIY